ncbi:unnamed protein product, partial [Calicophoron daubneyi]
RLDGGGLTSNPLSASPLSAAHQQLLQLNGTNQEKASQSMLKSQYSLQRREIDRDWRFPSHVLNGLSGVVNSYTPIAWGWFLTSPSPSSPKSAPTSYRELTDSPHFTPPSYVCKYCIGKSQLLWMELLSNSDDNQLRNGKRCADEADLSIYRRPISDYCQISSAYLVNKP